MSGCSCFASYLYLVFICSLVTGGVRFNFFREVVILEKDGLVIDSDNLSIVNYDY